MNEVSLSKAVNSLTVAGASSKGTVEAQSRVSGNNLPDQNEKPENSKAPQVPANIEVDLESEVASINDYVQSIQRDLQFSVDKELDRTVIKVVDRDSGDIIRQIPEDIFLELARRLKDDGELQLVNALG